MSIIGFMAENQKELTDCAVRHMELVGISVFVGIAVSVPLGILLSRFKKMASPVLATAGTIQTIPGLVMLGFALILFGIGMFPALAALSLYAILPILRNTYTGITEVNESYKEAGRGIGMTGMQILFKIELPLALPSIIGGIRISTVYIVSWATLAALIGAGGLGDPIWTGLATCNTNLILSGAIPSAVLAFVLSSLIGFLQRIFTPRGLKAVRV
jgi:osmoprotectant transport system permease protein